METKEIIQRLTEKEMKEIIKFAELSEEDKKAILNELISYLKYSKECDNLIYNNKDYV